MPTATQLALIKRVRGLLPDGAQVILVGDAGFSSVLVLRELEGWGWHATRVVRQRGDFLLQRPGQSAWERLDSLVTAANQQVWLAQVSFTAKWQHPTAVLACWQAGYERPWLLTTNLTTARDARQAYARRMGIEEMFGHWKGHGWDIETTHTCTCGAKCRCLRHPARLSRLVLALALLYIWLVLAGERLIQAGWRSWVDRSDRRDLSLFRIGLDILQRCFTLIQDVPIPLPSLVGAASVR